MKNFYNFLREVYHFLNGNNAYKSYLASHNKNNNNCQKKNLKQKKIFTKSTVKKI